MGKIERVHLIVNPNRINCVSDQPCFKLFKSLRVLPFTRLNITVGLDIEMGKTN